MITKITTPELFNLQSNTEGTRLPVMTTTERIAMTGMSNGELIFNSTTDSVEYYDLGATAWYKIDYIAPEGTFFNTLLYTGDGTASKSITGAGFQPDFVWIYDRDSGNSNPITDVIGDPTRILLSANSDPQQDSTYRNNFGQLTSFDSNGFTVEDGSLSNGAFNKTGANFCAFCFKAGGTASNNTEGSITSAVSANIPYGFSIVRFTSNSSASLQVGHGLDSTPELMIYKAVTTPQAWYAETSVLGSGWFEGEFSSVGAITSRSGTMANSTLINSFTGGAGITYMAYCFHSVTGKTKVGSYDGNGSSGQKITTGFKPSFILIKNTAYGGNWDIINAKTDPATNKTKILRSNLNSAETTSSSSITFDSDGFTLNGASFNTNGDKHLFYATTL